MLRIVHKDGKPCPVIFCDCCGQPIEDAERGNYQWQADGRVFFTHKECCYPFERAHGGFWYANPLPIYLGNGLRLDWPAAWRTANLLADL